MTKAAAVTHVLAIFVATALAASAHRAPNRCGCGDQYLRHNGKPTRFLLRQKLVEANDAVLRRDLPAAAKTYDAAVELVGQIRS